MLVLPPNFGKLFITRTYAQMDRDTLVTAIFVVLEGLKPFRLCMRPFIDFFQAALRCGKQILSHWEDMFEVLSVFLDFDRAFWKVKTVIQLLLSVLVSFLSKIRPEWAKSKLYKPVDQQWKTIPRGFDVSQCRDSHFGGLTC